MRVIFFDFDGVLSPATHGMELARLSGREDEIQKLFSSFSKSKTGVEWAVYRGISFFQGMEQGKMALIAQHLPLTPNVGETIAQLKEAGYHPVIVTSGIQEVAESFGTRVGIEEVYGNSLEIRDGMLTGKFTRHPLLTIKSKGKLVREYLKRNSMQKKDVVGVGNDENDWAMFYECGFSILFNPSTRLLGKIEESMKKAEAGKKRDFYDVLRHINVVIKENDLSFILPFLVPDITMFPERLKIKKSKYL